MHKGLDGELSYPILTSADRKRLGRFDTPRPIAQAMTDWAVRSATDTILEPSVGGCVFVRSATARLISLGSLAPYRQVHACDIDPQPCADAKVAGIPANQVHLGDFLEFTSPLRFTAVVGNPPYVSLRKTSQATRDAYFTRSSKEGFNHKKGSLWAHFVIKAHSCLALGGRLAFLLPEAVLYTDYGRGLLDWASQRFARCSLISIRERCFLSEGTNERVVIVLFDGCSEGPSDGVAINEFATIQDAIEFLGTIDPQAVPSGERINGHVIPQAISSSAHDVYARLESYEGITTLGDLAKINIGVVTGANSFFVLSEKERIAKRLRKTSLIPCLTKFSDCQSSFRFCESTWKAARDNGRRVWLFHPQANTSDKAAVAHIATFPEELIEPNKTFAKRNPWFRPVVPPTPDGFLRYMGADGPKLALNEAEGTSTNTIHHILFKKPLPRYRKRALALAIQSTITQLSAEFVGRSYGSGVLKLEPSDCRKLLVPVPNSTQREVDDLWKRCVEYSALGEHGAATSSIDHWIYSAQSGSNLPVLEVLKDLLEDARLRREG
jgi:adenine-specific DNA-methyltransferase